MNPLAAYYFPFAHIDPLNERVHGSGWTEWELMKLARPRFEGHRQPRIPLWGYEDESDPEVMARKAAAASAHGLEAFVFDWYWYEGRPAFHGALDKGFLGTGQTKLKFALMWANHDWISMHPVNLWQARTGKVEVLFPGTVSEDEFLRMCRHVIERYFLNENYWRVGGKPYFSIYNLSDLLGSFGSVARAAEMLARFRQEAEAFGLPGLHLNAIEVHTPNIPHEEALHEWPEIIAALGFDSVTSYSWAHFTGELLDGGGRERRIHYPYGGMDERLLALWSAQREKFAVPFFPHVSVGWDSSPRTVQSDQWENIGEGPFSFIWNDANPEDFRRYLGLAADFASRSPGECPVIINAWNEWPESSYLEPDTVHGMAYLEAVKSVAARARDESVVRQ
jgi:hypothetical protein